MWCVTTGTPDTGWCCSPLSSHAVTGTPNRPALRSEANPTMPSSRHFKSQPARGPKTLRAPAQRRPRSSIRHFGAHRSPLRVAPQARRLVVLVTSPSCSSDRRAAVRSILGSTTPSVSPVVVQIPRPDTHLPRCVDSHRSMVPLDRSMRSVGRDAKLVQWTPSASTQSNAATPTCFRFARSRRAFHGSAIPPLRRQGRLPLIGSQRPPPRGALLVDEVDAVPRKQRLPGPPP